MTENVVLKELSSMFVWYSDTGGDAPESCIFGQFLNMISLISKYIVKYSHQAHFMLSAFF